MRYFLLCCFLFSFIILRVAAAGELREIELFDGNTITGEVLSLVQGVYTVKTPSLGTIRIDESKIRSIRSPSATPSPSSGSGVSNGDVQSLQKKMLGDKEIMNLIESLRNDPEFQKILEDPALLKAVESGDIAALQANPDFMKLLNNATVKEIGKKVR
jgi:hypothetical protein